jgi:2-dehydro-3-deoxyphosphogalactonate aldolase
MPAMKIVKRAERDILGDRRACRVALCHRGQQRLERALPSGHNNARCQRYRVYFGRDCGGGGAMDDCNANLEGAVRTVTIYGLHDISLIAILRGISPHDVIRVGDILAETGFRCIEVPLNSPDAITSINLLAAHFGSAVLIGAGTVLSTHEVDQVADAGGGIIISPNFNPVVIAHAKTRGLLSLPAFATPSEAFAAIAAGADGLKLFPAEALAPATLRAMRAVLPKDMPVFPVGGIEPETMLAYVEAGANGFGIGGALYQPGRPIEDIEARARGFVKQWWKSSRPGECP